LETVFQPFAQLDTSLTRSAGGLGVGLALVRALVNLHGGTVTAASDGPGRGSEFVVRLPLGKDEGGLKDEPKPGHAAASEASSVSHPSSVVPKRVLVVDDNEDAADSLATLLELSGYEVRTAFGGGAALALAA